MHHRQDSREGVVARGVLGSAVGRLGCLFLLCAEITAGCTTVRTPLELMSMDPSIDHTAVARYHRQEAIRFWQLADERYARARVYEQLFGLDSDWVRGARLEAGLYEALAREEDQRADRHSALSRAGTRASHEELRPH